MGKAAWNIEASDLSCHGSSVNTPSRPMFQSKVGCSLVSDMPLAVRLFGIPGQREKLREKLEAVSLTVALSDIGLPQHLCHMNAHTQTQTHTDIHTQTQTHTHFI